MKSSDLERIETILRAIVSEAVKIAETALSALEDAQEGRFQDVHDEIKLAHILRRLEEITIRPSSDRD
jgi:hypothetical protein